MRKYLTQHSLKAFTILIPRNFELRSQGDNLLDQDFSIRRSNMFVSRFTNYIQSNKDENWKELSPFNFLSTFYDVQFEKETDEWFEFYLVLNESLNESIWLRLKHTIFNQYNSLIGFSDILQEVESLDKTDRLLIKRINNNARVMLENTKLLMDFEQLKDFNFDLKSNLVSPIEFLSSYLNHKRDEEEALNIKYELSVFESVVLNIDNKCFKNSLDLFCDILKETIDLSKSSLQLSVNDHCCWHFEYDFDTMDDAEFMYELQSINDFYGQGINLTYLSNRMFHLLYIRLVAEKLGAEFKMEINESSNPILIAEWNFPFVKLKDQNELNIGESSVDKKSKSKPLINEQIIVRSAELRTEIAKHFSKVNGAFVLDDWKVFAEKLDGLSGKFEIPNSVKFKQISKDIRSAIDEFDISALQRVMKKINRISKKE